jgi:lipooligosaccharide transport system permease protein
MSTLSVPHPILALAYRHAKVWARRLPVFLAMYILGPTIMLYGLGKAFGIQDQLAFILPGIMANSVAASGFINCSYGAMERFFNKRYEGWLAATMTVRQIVLAEALFQSFKGLLTATGIWLASLLLGGSLAVGAWAASLPVMMLVGWCASMLGYIVVALARNYDDIALSEPFMSAAFVFSGVFVVITQFPMPLQAFGMLLPIYHGIEAARPLFLGQPEAATYLLHMLVLAIMCGITTALAIKLFQRRLMD